MKKHFLLTRLSKHANFSLLLMAMALGTYSSCVSAEKAPLRVPLTPTEALNLGLDPGHDGMLFRVIQNSDGPISSSISKGQTLNYSVSAKEQRGVNSEVFLQDTADGRWCAVGSTGFFADIALNLPSASALTSMRIWGFDVSSSDLTVSLIERCTPNNQAGGVITSVIVGLTSAGNAGNFSQIIPIVANNTIDNDACTYTLRTRFSTPGDGFVCAGTSLRLQKIRFSYAP